MDCFGGLSGEGEWDLSMEDLDFMQYINIPQPMTDAAWFCSNFDSSSHFGNYDIDQFPCAAAAADHHHHHHMSIDEDYKNMESIFSATSTEILLHGFSSEADKFVNMDNILQTHLGDDDDTNALFHHKRKSIAVADDQNQLIKPNKKTRNSNKVQKSGKGRESSGNSKKVSSTRGRKCEEEEEENGRSPCDTNSCSSDNSSEDDNASQDNTNGVEPPKPKTRATRGSATDPQSLYARKRRERINERLRILQKLVPNGTKVDISTMLEEAVHYVKFLQLQIKLLSSDELWMYAPIAYNGMDIGLQQKLSSIL